MDRDLRRSAYISSFIHLALIVAAIVTLPLQPLPTSADLDVDVDLIGPTVPQRSTVKGPGAASAVGELHHSETMSEKAPKPQPVVAPPPPPPPPPPTPNQPQTKVTPSSAPPPPPPKPSEMVSPVPPPPPQKQQKQTSTAQQKEKPQEVKKPPAPAKIPVHQQHEVKTPELSQSVMNTLMNLKAQELKKQQVPTSTYNPDQNTAPTAGGSPNSLANSGLTGPDRAAIGSHVRPCWNVDSEAEGLSGFSVLLQVTTDATGTVRVANVDPKNTGDMSNPLYFAFTQRAIAAVLNAQCATLPLPQNMLGQNQTFSFQFAP
ncbi:MAG TPA: hypothetical protein VEQ16_01690 [Acidocella sp.]|nr:hypothetical protein [Acidocella sp.]